MKLTWNHLLVVVLLLSALVLVTGCAGQETPYEKNDALNYTVSVKYDANGGVFTTSTSVIVDSYNLSELPVDEDGNVRIALITPDDEARGNNQFTATRTGYFLAGWYLGCEMAGDGSHIYSKPWDFANDLLIVDPKQTYSSATPVLTLYAAWVPLFEVQVYDLDSRELLGSYTLNPNTESEIRIPQWNTETGAMDLYKFPVVAGKTINGVYYDAEGQQQVTDAVINHPGTVERRTATAEKPVLKLYADMLDGEWYHIYNVDQFVKNASLGGSYVLHEDLDFTDKIWPTVMMYGSFTGTIEGNGHKISNVVIEQTNNSKTNAGLFGAFGESAKVSDLTFENVRFTIKSGTRMAGTSYGLLAGTVAEGAQLDNVSVLASTLVIGESAYFGTDDYVIGLVCGMGNAYLTQADITCTCELSGKNAVVTGNMVTLEDAPQ